MPKISTSDDSTLPLNPTSKKLGIQSVEKAFEVLEAIKSGEAHRLTDIVKATGLKRNLVHAYLTSLLRVGMVSQDPATALYSLGGTAIRLGLAALSTMDFQTVARAVMLDLRDRIEESVWLSVWSERGPVIVSRVDGLHGSPFELRIGTIIDLTVTSSGMSFLAHLERSVWDALVRHERKRLGRAAPPLAEVLKSLEVIRRDGIVAKIGIVVPQKLRLPQFSSIAAPVFDHSGGLRAVLTVIGPSELLDLSLKGRIAAELKASARHLSANLGYRV